ncbi:unnamed protein product [Trichogramma brassicae]|uniref:Reverse transcriptase zinc-binding domain-containing protein n=1 Tax=Trichogramma brassicae TaxID=86971 RepID=A0A6H5I3C7_9HYME|nr:unnamed protein product [Trichogramma brassicae]
MSSVTALLIHKDNKKEKKVDAEKGEEEVTPTAPEALVKHATMYPNLEQANRDTTMYPNGIPPPVRASEVEAGAEGMQAPIHAPDPVEARIAQLFENRNICIDAGPFQIQIIMRGAEVAFYIAGHFIGIINRFLRCHETGWANGPPVYYYCGWTRYEEGDPLFDRWAHRRQVEVRPPPPNSQRKGSRCDRCPCEDHAQLWRAQKQPTQAVCSRRRLHTPVRSPRLVHSSTNASLHTTGGVSPPTSLPACDRRPAACPHVAYEATYVLAGIPPLALLADERARLYGRRREDAKDEERLATLSKWQEAWDRSKKARWTHRLIPNIRVWIERRHGGLNYHLTQLLTGHGFFKHHSRRYDYNQSAQCPVCPSSIENAEHVFYHCPRFSEERERLHSLLYEVMTPENTTRLMLAKQDGFVLVGHHRQQKRNQPAATAGSARPRQHPKPRPAPRTVHHRPDVIVIRAKDASSVYVCRHPANT